MKTYRNLNPTEKEIEFLIKSAKARVKLAEVLFEEKLYRDTLSNG